MKRKTVATVLATAAGVMMGIGGSTVYADQLSNVNYTDAVKELQNADTEKTYASEEVEQAEADVKRAASVKSDADRELDNAVRAEEDALAEKEVVESTYDQDAQVDDATKEEVDEAYIEYLHTKGGVDTAEECIKKANNDIATAENEINEIENQIKELEETVSEDEYRKTETKSFFEWMRDNVDVFISEGLIPAQDRDAFIRDQERAIMQFSPEETYFYSFTHLGEYNDATNVAFIKNANGKSIFDWVRECIEKRKEDLTIEHSYSQQYSDDSKPELRISSELMAAAELALNYACSENGYHASVREDNALAKENENVTRWEDLKKSKWREYYDTEVVSGGMSDPYTGWVDEERRNYMIKNGYVEGEYTWGGQTGHYTAVANLEYDTIGFAYEIGGEDHVWKNYNAVFSEKGKKYGLSVDTYELLFNRYYETIDVNALKLSKMRYDLEEKKKEKKYAEDDLAEWTSEAELRKADCDSKYAAYQDLLSRYQKNDDLDSARTKANAKYESAKKRTESARAKAERAASSLKDAESYLAKTKKNYAKALDTVKNAEEAYKTAVDNIDIVYRLYYAPTKEHLFTTDANERKVLVSKYGWIDENVAWVSPKNGAPVYRLFNPFTTDHHYTASKHESDTLVAKYGWILDGVVFHASDRDDAVAVRRLWNRGLKTGSHHFTTSVNEYNTNVTRGWVGEDIAFRVEAADYIELDRPTDMKTYRSSNDDTITLTGTSKASKLSSGMKSGTDSSCRKESKASATKSSDAKTPKRAAATGVSLWAGISYIAAKRKRNQDKE
uniref:hypothetical protein n=1 Tax=Eubacterium cellulosolvens TaxID=29322 RepID=UPI000688B4DC|nr:hypothetical protein [[Eubacterium] cellulosolvens]